MTREAKETLLIVATGIALAIVGLALVWWQGQTA